MSLVNKFLAIQKWKDLLLKYRSSSQNLAINNISYPSLILCIALSSLPIISSIYFNSELAAIIFGSTCILAIVLRNKLKFPKINFYKEIKKDLTLTHTAFALGCIPAVFVILFYPEVLSEHSNAITKCLKPRNTHIHTSMLELFAYTIFLSLWIAVTEEVVFRGLLLSALRRSKAFIGHKHRDLIVIIISSIIFGLAHYNHWGLQAAISTTGLGIGFGIAYICSNERLLPLIIYHFIFDLLSLSAVLLLK